mmetsp:Transcript_106521/g.306269  ORF Transcript_106521/g.306269 Transcript_106521/m.306269 type:complete len:353 (-) Transcript_106521:112-1170(-)
MAPPFTLMRSKLPPKKVFATARGTGAKASLTSTTSSCSGFRPLLFKACAVAGIGPSSIITGSAPTTAMAAILAIGRRPSFCKPRSLQIRSAAAPSQICEEVAGVTIPFLSMGFNFATASSLVDRTPSSRSCTSSGLSPLAIFTRSGTISFLKWPASVACMARSWLKTAKRSSSSRVHLYFFATSSAAPNWLKCCGLRPNSSSCLSDSPYADIKPSPAGKPCPHLAPSMTPAPIGTCDMFSTPPAITQSWLPLMTACAAKWMACWPEPHWRSTATPGTSSGRRLELSTAMRAMLALCAPTWLTHPTTTSSTSLPCMPALSINPSRTAAHKSAGCQPLKRPFLFPPALRTASTM